MVFLPLTVSRFTVVARLHPIDTWWPAHDLIYFIFRVDFFQEIISVGLTMS